jgi:hypothetical protein
VTVEPDEWTARFRAALKEIWPSVHYDGRDFILCGDRCFTFVLPRSLLGDSEFKVGCGDVYRVTDMAAFLTSSFVRTGKWLPESYRQTRGLSDYVESRVVPLIWERMCSDLSPHGLHAGAD